MSVRVIHSHSPRLQAEIADLLQSIFVAELMYPSRCMWIVSPWITNVNVIDNHLGTFTGLEPSWEPRGITLIEVLTDLMGRGTHLRLAVRPNDHSERFVSELTEASNRSHVQAQLATHVREELHEKGILGDTYYLSGSMNITYGGIYKLDEAVRIELDPTVIAATRLDFHKRWGGKLADGDPA